MRITRKLFLTTAFAALLGVGAFVGVSFNSTSDVKPVEVEAASDKNHTLFFTSPYSSWSSWSGNIKSITLEYYVSGASGNANVSMSKTYTNNLGQDIYSATLPKNSERFKFWAETSTQGTKYSSWVGVSITNDTTGYYFNDSWSGSDFNVASWSVTKFSVSFDSNGGSGTMTAQSCYCNANSGNNLKTNAFTRYGYTFTGWNTQSDGKGTSYSGGAHINSSTTDTITLYAQWTHSTGRYIVGKFGSCNWGIEGAIFLNPINSQYEGQVTFSFGDVFKIAYYNGSNLESYFGYSWIRSGCGAYQYFGGSGDSDITCYARGTYNFYFRDVEYETGKKISIELDSSYNAEHLAAKLMSYGPATPGEAGDRTCGDKFPACKTFYLESLDDDEKAVFQGYASSANEQFKNAYDRYIAWAAALGQKPWALGAVNGTFVIGNSSSDSSGSTFAIIAITSVSLVALGGYFLFKKKHQ